MNWADWVVRGFALYGVAFFSWQVGKHGVRWVMSEVTGWFSVAKNEFLALEARVKAIEAHPALSIPPIVGQVNTPKVGP